ncbi:glycosyltransferase family 2 protein [Salinivibrio proteolyticus]|uniref:glycosyltransferase family 2 protein n=1 Tax=Salinivibrio proteolyticus TaxID=334715 RepID=UPI0009896A56|nr:glycosyltransferase family A protein [Salinivibrio proteolyticus]OOF31688.1 hypothetical protein BZJ20_03815 [Salinivibrio proteolyticus]
METTSLSKANQLLRNKLYDDAFDEYLQCIRQCPELDFVFFNLAYLMKKSHFNKDMVNKKTKSIYKLMGLNEKDYKAVKRSKYVNGKWYLEEYKGLVPNNVDPILHYMSIGWRLGFNPCKRFDTNFYIYNYNDQIGKEELPLLHYLYKGKSRGYQIKSKEESGTSMLGAKLWNGHSESALKELELIYNDESATDKTRWWSMWHTARWLYFIGNISGALDLSYKMSSLESGYPVRKESIYLRYFCLLSLGRVNDAYNSLKPFVEHNLDDTDGYFAFSNSQENDEKRIEMINRAYSIKGFSGIRRKDRNRPLSIDNVVGLPVSKITDKLKVSIIMPIYNAGNQIRVAIDSLLQQSYKNIEIIAVDDCSPDNTFDILKELEKKDPRIKAIQPPENGGAYAARNYGLTFATGDLLTTHDSDDWSHPQKIATQVQYLKDNPSVMGCSAHWIRARENLSFTQNWRPNNRLIHWSQSSFMFRRKVLESIGEWDHVRIGGDTEYIWRMQAKFGKDSFAKICPDTPLAFALDEESSLTRTKSTHVRTVYYGLRHIYREICAWWHSSNDDLLVKKAKLNRVFPAPRSMYERSDEILHFDTIIAGDFSRKKDCEIVKKIIKNNPGKKTALFHWPCFYENNTALCDIYFELLGERNIDPIVMGQNVESTDYFITDEKLTVHPLDGYPNFIGLESWISKS